MEENRDMFKNCWEIQEKLFGAWKDSFNYLRPGKMTELYEKQADVFKGAFWPGSDLVRFYLDWFRQTSQTMEELVRWSPGKIGTETIEKLLQATEVYTKLFAFWQDFAGGMPGKGEQQKWLQFTESMLENYNRVLESFFMVNLPDPLKELVRNPLEVGGLYRQALTNLLKPWLQSSEVLQEKFLKSLQGDRQACVDFAKACTEAYQESTGKFLRMPALGLSKDNVEKILGSFDSFNKLTSSVTNLSATMYQVGYEVMEKLMQSMVELSKKGAAPESFKEFYETWWQANEEAYFKLFRTESFSKILGEMVDATVTFKKGYDDLLMELIAGSLPVVNNKEMDSLVKVVYDLKKKMKEQTKKIEELSRLLESLKEKGADQ